MSGDSTFLIIGLIFTALVGWLLVNGFRTGSMRSLRGMAGDRRHRPHIFWMNTAANAVLLILALLCLVVGVLT